MKKLNDATMRSVEGGVRLAYVADEIGQVKALYDQNNETTTIEMVSRTGVGGTWSGPCGGQLPQGVLCP